MRDALAAWEMQPANGQQERERALHAHACKHPGLMASKNQ